MTKLEQDILREPGELTKCLAFTMGEGKAALDKAARLVKGAPVVYITGIGSSWNAGLAIQTFFHAAAKPVVLVESSEMLYYGEVPKKATVIVLSRSGKSVEIVRLLDKFAAAEAKIIAITNTPDSPLALKADVVLKEEAAFDNAVSVSMYTALVLVGGLLAVAATGKLDGSLAKELQNAIDATPAAISKWQDQVNVSPWLDPKAPMYLLARGPSVASCHETRLLWEEAAKVPASAMPTGGFRHGPQEVIRENMRIALWIERETMRTQDLALAADLRKLGVKVLLIGQDLKPDAADLVLNLPAIRGDWQFLLDIIPAQVTSEALARRGGQDCDNFRLCSYIVEDEGGLIPAGMKTEDLIRK